MTTGSMFASVSGSVMCTVMLVGGVLLGGAAAAHELEGKVKGQVDAIAGILTDHPEMVIDFTRTSGEYCLNTWKVGGGHMTHYATDPATTTEDVVDFVKVSSLQGAVDVDSLPRAPTVLKAKKPNQWYYLPAGRFDPHHGKPAKVPMLVRATDTE